MVRKLLASASRLTMCVALLCYCISIIVLSLGRGDINWADFVAASLASVAGLGLIAHASDAIELPGEDYAYLVTGYAGFSTLLLYLINTDDPSGHRFAVTLLLLTGTIGGYGAHLSQVEFDAIRGWRG